MGNRIKVLVLIKGLGVGGAEKLLQLSLRHWDRDRFDYEVGYLLPWKDALVTDFQQAGIPVHCLNQRKAYDLGAVPRLVRLLRHRRVDLLHLHLPYAASLGRVASKLAPVKGVVYTEHNVWERYNRFTYMANRWTYGWNDAVIAVSDDVERSIRANYKVNGKPQLSTILNGIDLDQLVEAARGHEGVRPEFGIPQDHHLVVHVANFTPKKRHTDLLAAAQIALQQDPAITFLLVGQGPLEAEIKAQAQDLGIAHQVVFTGFRVDAPRLMAAADLFVLPSQYEGLPISLLEAMALGRPVVASSVGGVPEVITDGVEGLLVQPLNPRQLAEKMLTVLHTPELQARFSQNGPRRVQEQFGVQRMIAATEALYSQLLSDKVRA